LIMQPSPYDQPVMIDPMTGMPSNVIIVQQPNASPTVMGILIIIYGAGVSLLSLLALIGLGMMMDSNSELYDPVFANNSGVIYGSMILNLILMGMLVFGGVLILKRKSRGIHLCWLAIGLIFALDMIVELTYPEISAADPNSFGTGINVAINAVCNIVCGVLVAIPLMITNSGMDDSRLF
ncbi:MAG: hypothetical protein QGG96_05785, partial [Candidatus Poseidoniaceae archaeon]|nr:hypothetical protein [Candidatus Poseidoniaceae archaeon]